MPPTLSKIEHQLSMRLRLAPLFFAYFVFASLAAAENLLPNGDFEEVNGS